MKQPSHMRALPHCTHILMLFPFGHKKFVLGSSNFFLKENSIVKIKKFGLTRYLSSLALSLNISSVCTKIFN